MKCFQHETVDAVGLCKSCLKAVCRACAVDLDRGLACRNRCEDRVRGLIELVDSNVAQRATHRGLIVSVRLAGFLSAAFLMTMGALFTWWSLDRDEPLRVTVVMGILFMLFGAAQFVRMLRVPPVPKTPGIP